MKVLVLGYSNIFKKRILNFFLKKKIAFCIASSSSHIKHKKAYKWFNNYGKAIKETNTDAVYISLSNSLHYKWAKLALEKNYHVIVDKPITLKLKESLKLVRIARKKRKLLAESTFFNFHKQFETSCRLTNGKKNIKFINTNFIIPKPNKNSFRMSKKLGGGCVSDMGPYAAATARLLGSGRLINIKSNVYKERNGLITSFDVFCKFKNNHYFGYFSFDGEYKNNMILHTKYHSIELNNVFSPPSNKNLNILIKKNNIVQIKKIKKDDVFKNFFNKVTIAIKKKSFKLFYEKIIFDAKIRDKIR